MPRLTGSDAFGLMEAYAAVYAPQELTEEQVWEEVEVWVNSLVEEGYDLSEYTWEDMYEAYLSEIPINPATSGSTTKGAVTMYGPNDPRRTQSGPVQSRFSREAPSTAIRTRAGTQSGRLSSMGPGYRGDELSLAARARASQVGTPRQGTAGGPTVGGNTPIGPSPTRPAAPAPSRPAAPAPSRPAAPAPTQRPATSVLTQRPAAPAPTQATTPRQSVAQDVADLRAMRKASQQRIIAQGGTPVTPLVQSFDPFDIVMGHLIDEGYAEGEEAAAVIMANMSEEWRDEILDEANRPEREMIGKGLLKPGQVGRVRNLNRAAAEQGGTDGGWYGQDPRDQPDIQRPGRSLGRTGPMKLKQRRQRESQKFDKFYTAQRRDEHNQSRGKKTKG